MQRTFIAFKIIPEREMADCIQHVQDVLRGEKIKWVDHEKMHITLCFLGDTSPTQVKSTIKILEEEIPLFPAQEVLFAGLGLFRSIRDPRVIWIGMDPGPVLPELKTRIDRKLVQLGFTPEERKFRPHLTLGRIKSTGNHSPEKNSPEKNFPEKNSGMLEGLLGEYRNMRFQKNLIREVIYYESILRKEGAEYLPLKRVAFHA